MTVKYKQLKFFALGLVVAVATLWVAAPRVTYADPVPSCAGGATLVPASGNTPAHCACPAGQTLVTGNPNTCVTDANVSQVCTGAVGTDATGQKVCNATSLTQAQQTGCDNNNKPRFIGLVPWYEYLTITTDPIEGCKITNFDDSTKIVGAASPLLLIALAILDDLVRIAALVAVGFIVYGGVQYVTSQGAPDSTKQAQQTIINALIGLVVALIATPLVSYIGNKLGG